LDPIQRSRQLRQEADEVLQAVDLLSLLAPYGPITYTGSYYLDVMVYPDIDILVPRISIEQLFAVAAGVAAHEIVPEVVFQRSRDESLPGGLYLKPRVHYGQWERPWKIDIWSLDEVTIEQKMHDMRRFRAAMDEAMRSAIIRYKCSILTSAGRTPMSSGYFIYKAFIDEDLTDHAAITRYLIASGIQMDPSKHV
jgi:hypothetical protein